MDLPRTSAAVAGISSIALGLVTITGPAVPDAHWGTRGSVVNALGLVTFAALVIAVELVPRLLGLGRTGRAAVRVTQVGLLLMTVESVASQIHGGNTLGPVFMLGLLLTIIGFLVSGIEGIVRPGARWLALLPLAAFVVAIGTGDRGGFLVLGLAWGWLGVGTAAVLARREAVGERVPVTR
jgi:hypothetical protein